MYAQDNEEIPVDSQLDLDKLEENDIVNLAGIAHIALFESLQEFDDQLKNVKGKDKSVKM